MSASRLKALLHVTSAKLDEGESDDFITSQMEFLVEESAMFKNPKNVEHTQLVLKCLINLCSTTIRNQLFFGVFSTDHDRSEFLRNLEELWMSCLAQDLETGYLVISLLCNLTRDTCWSSIALQKDPKSLIDCIFFTDQTLTSSLPLLLNLTSHKEVRQLISVTASLRNRLINLLLSQTADTNRALLVTGILKNCFFDDDYHLLWLAPQSKMLESLLKPLCGPEDCLDEEDRQKLPMGLQTISGCANAVRTQSMELKQTICEALLQLCSTSDGRTRLRDSGVYFVLRELHKFETANLAADSKIGTENRRRANEVLYHIEQVVDQLICKEEERDQYTVEHSLRSLDVDPGTSAKLNQAKQDFITAI